MVTSAAGHKDDSLFLKSPRELFLLFAGGEITTSKPKPDPVPDIPKETVPLAVKSASQADTVVTNHTDWMSKLNPLHLFSGAAHGPSKDPNLVCYKAQVSIERANVAGIDIANPISDIVEIGQELINNHVTLQLVSNELDPGKLLAFHGKFRYDLVIGTS